MLSVQINEAGAEKELFAVTVLFPKAGFVFKLEALNAQIAQVLCANALNYLQKATQAGLATDEALALEITQVKQLRPVLKCDVPRETDPQQQASQAVIDQVVEKIANEGKIKLPERPAPKRTKAHDLHHKEYKPDPVNKGKLVQGDFKGQKIKEP